jgi:maltose alpha-D-glucosyltransferase/alpha-amylase
MGGVVFPRIGELTYLLTLPGHGFYWFQLPAARDERSAPEPAGAGTAGEQFPGPPESHQH